ncbi:major facilitator transporter [Candidatus Francisella endociliophora]|uniref:Major facilitator transporter n=1 Tax=Candidatus Francisella endociliophora TaxID=653937 RepID=A0A097EMD8_9GAMM|nr:oligopeptide:H+ symporter [Francisella sp. FSC1006]AIT08730.1 major facilitator transporter [Francisella sp. FSC1006]
MIIDDINHSKSQNSVAPFWVLWTLELWERFGYYGLQAILAIYFAKKLGFSDGDAMLIFGSFSALLYGGPLIGGWIGDSYLGAKRTIFIGAGILFLSYLSLSFATVIAEQIGSTEKTIVMYSLAGVAIGFGLFKPNPTSLISKLFEKGDPALDGAMTMYYMAINIGSFVSMLITPFVAAKFGYLHAFLCSAIGMLLGLISYIIFYPKIAKVSTDAGLQKFSWSKAIIVIIGSLIAITISANILENTNLCTAVVIVIAIIALIYFFVQMIKQPEHERKRMIVALILIIQGIIFFVLYQQMPTSLNFFAVNNVNPHFLGMTLQGEQWQVLNPLAILVVSPLLSIYYRKSAGTHVTKFCFGMTLCAMAFLVLYLPQFTATDGIVSGWWLVLTYFLQSTGELLISALGLSMVAELFPRKMSGFALGMWALTTMVAGPIGGYVGALTAPAEGVVFTKVESVAVYGNVFLTIGIFVTIVAAIMWAARGWLNSIIESTRIHIAAEGLHGMHEEASILPNTEDLNS